MKSVNDYGKDAVYRKKTMGTILYFYETRTYLSTVHPGRSDLNKHVINPVGQKRHVMFFVTQKNICYKVSR